MVKFIVKKAVAKKAHAHGFMVSSMSYQALDDKVNMLIEKAGKRAKANKRKTIMPHDF
jgi:histone H3/H4